MQPDYFGNLQISGVVASCVYSAFLGPDHYSWRMTAVLHNFIRPPPRSMQQMRKLKKTYLDINYELVTYNSLQVPCVIQPKLIRPMTLSCRDSFSSQSTVRKLSQDLKHFSPCWNSHKHFASEKIHGIDRLNRMKICKESNPKHYNVN
jgi:hypothetical protein